MNATAVEVFDNSARETAEGVGECELQRAAQVGVLAAESWMRELVEGEDDVAW